MRRLAIVLLACVACSSSGDDETPSRDGGVVVPFDVRVGVGRLTFEPITGTETVELVRGPQGGGRLGGFHVWTAVALEDVEPDEIDVLTFTLTTTGAVTQSEIVRRPDGIQFEPCGPDLCSAGFAPRLEDCCVVSGRKLVIRVHAAAFDGRTATDEATTNAGICSECP